MKLFNQKTFFFLKNNFIKFIFISLFQYFFIFNINAQEKIDTVHIPEIEVVSFIKTDENLQRMPCLINSYNQYYLNNHNIKNFKDFSTYCATLFIPDYGSKITSSIYLRGLGSRIDNSAVGICLDGVMLLNKNCFDFSYFDLDKVNIYKGSQSLTFGMNTLAGVISLYTLSPFDYQGIKANIGFANGNAYNGSFSYYNNFSQYWKYVLGVDFSSNDGYFDNVYNNKNCDWIRDFNGRMIIEYRKNQYQFKNSSYISAIHQGGYPYCLFDTVENKIYDVNYNDFSGYDRFNFINNTSYIYKNAQNFSFQSLTSVQLNFDKMQMDNDFTEYDYFTMEQKQKDYGFSQEFIIKDDNKNNAWNWLGGMFMFYKSLSMQAPVLFKKDGIQTMILDNANKGLHNMFENYNLFFKDNNMLITNDFKYNRYVLATYFQTDYTWKKWNIEFAMRFDWENISLDYESYTNIMYMLQPIMSNYKPLNTILKGDNAKNYIELLPKLAISYNMKCGNAYLSISKGYMTGGYNTSMFADIIRNQLMQDLLKDMGIYTESGSAMEDIYANYNKYDIIKYKPQYIWNYEIGSKLKFLDNKLIVNFAVFYMNVTNQQLTIFLNPQTTGRMMTNAAKSKSIGTEIEINAKIKNLDLHINYGYTNAKFIEYNDGKMDYKNKYLTYYPVNTVSFTSNYLLKLNNVYIDNINFSLSYNGIGNIYYNQQNTIKQKFYSLLNSDITIRKNIYSLSFYARNILNNDYTTFYFQSNGNNFYQKGKPIVVGIKFAINS